MLDKVTNPPTPNVRDAVNAIWHNQSKRQDCGDGFGIPLELLLDELAAGRPVLDILVLLHGQIAREPPLLVLSSGFAKATQALSKNSGHHVEMVSPRTKRCVYTEYHCLQGARLTAPNSRGKQDAIHFNNLV